MPADLTREEIAAGVRLEGWRWIRGILVRFEDGARRCDWCRIGGEDNDNLSTPIEGSAWLPVVDDPATAGCLLDLLGPGWAVRTADSGVAVFRVEHWIKGLGVDMQNLHIGPNLGTACFRAALARGRWG